MRSILFLGMKYLEESIVRTNERLKNFTSASIFCACLKMLHVLFLYLVRTYHPRLQCAKPILCAHECRIPVCQRTC